MNALQFNHRYKYDKWKERENLRTLHPLTYFNVFCFKNVEIIGGESFHLDYILVRRYFHESFYPLAVYTIVGSHQRYFWSRYRESL